MWITRQAPLPAGDIAVWRSGDLALTRRRPLQEWPDDQGEERDSAERDSEERDSEQRDSEEQGSEERRAPARPGRRIRIARGCRGGRRPVRRARARRRPPGAGIPWAVPGADRAEPAHCVVQLF